MQARGTGSSIQGPEGRLTGKGAAFEQADDVVRPVRGGQIDQDAPSAAVFLRHTLDSPVVNLVPEIRELVAGAVASLKYDNVSVMLVPVRESVTVPDTKLPSPLLSPGAHTPALLLQMLAMAAVLLALGVGGWVYGRRLLARRRAAREALEAGEGDDTGKQGEA